MDLSPMKIEMWPVDKPVPYAKNARKISDQAVDKVASSIQAFGFRQPIVVDKEGVIVVGHARLLGAKKLGLKLVPVHRADNLAPSRPGEFHPEPLTEPCVNLSIYTARAIHEGLPPSATTIRFLLLPVDQHDP